MAAAGTTAARANAPAWLRALNSSTGTKAIIALSGISLVGFLVLHLAGNLTFLLGHQAFNEYAHKMTSLPIVYIFEAGLLAVFLLHALKAAGNYTANRAARGGQGYAKVAGGHLTAKRPGSKSRKSVASSSSILTGLVIVAFVVIHLKGLKFGPSELAYYDGHAIRDLYTTQLLLFAQPVWVVVYTVSMLLIGMHMWHGIWSAFQSFGLANSKYLPLVAGVGKLVAVVLTVGFIGIPIYTFLLANGHLGVVPEVPRPSVSGM